ncbi:MAG: FliM/FliN family flagellar motor switch protein [Gemmatimonadaceae bacterium]|jgi:flagellar motor switch protein FliM|nr:FliM/FliN family flagellar motor switch protein [Gemmatimonadaceae bacterium]
MATDSTLSQFDIDRLLGGAGAVAPVAAAAELDVQVYDFRRPHRVSKERLRTLEAMYERMVKSLEAWLIGRVRGQIEVRLQSVEQFSFGEFTLSLPTPCASYVFDVRGAHAQGVVDIGQEFAFHVIDRLFGGTGQATFPNRSLTPVERMALRTIGDRIVALTAEIWQDHVAMELQITSFESAPEILQIANREDPVLVANIEVSAGNVSSLVLVCLPFNVLDKFFATAGEKRVNTNAASPEEREHMRIRSEAGLRATRVPISVRLPSFQVPLARISELTPGAVLPTGIPRDARVVVRTGEQPRFSGQVGRVSGHLAVRILDAATPAATASDDE